MRLPLLHILLFLTFNLFAVVTHRSNAQQHVQISTAFSDTLLCLGETFNVPVVTGPDTFKHINLFRVQLSDSDGNFNNATQIGIRGDFQSTIISCTVPQNTLLGHGYRIRVIADAPSFTSNPNGVDIRVSDYPNINVTSNSPVCQNLTLNLGATTSGASPSFSWVGPNGFTSNQQNPNITPATLQAEGTYRAYVTSYGCTTTDTIPVNVFPPPKIDSFQSKAPVCEGQNFDISVFTTPSTSLLGKRPKWTYPDGSTRDIGAIQVFNATMADSGNYKVIVQIGNSSQCRDSAIFHALVRKAPDSPAASNNGPICVGDTLLLTGQAREPGLTYRWEGPNNFSSNTLNAQRNNVTSSDEGDYLIYAIKNGCDSKPGKTSVKIGAPLTPIPIKGDTMLCPGDKLQLSGITNNLTGIFKWSGPNGFNSFSRTFSINPVKAKHAGTYTITRTLNGCTSPESFVTVNIPDIIPPSPSSNSPVCENATLEISAQSTQGGSYSWSGPSSFSSTEQNISISPASLPNSGVYTITTTLEHCTETDTLHATVKPNPSITSIGSNSPICNFDELRLNTTSNMQGASFTWSGPKAFTSNEQNPSAYFTTDKQGQYSVTATVNGCESEKSTTYVIIKEGPDTRKASNSSPVKEGDAFQLFAHSTKDGVNFLWEGPDGFSSTLKDPIIDLATYANNGTYTLRTVYNTCTLTHETVVFVEDILGIVVDLYPNPNNGTFTIKGIAQSDDNLDLVIFNHLGKVVHISNIQTQGYKFKQQVDLKNVSNGVYVLQLTGGGITKRIKFTVVN